MPKHKYSWGKFINSFRHIETYQVHIIETSAYGENLGKRPAITITFKSKYMAKIFLYWLTVLGGTDRYEANVYLEDVLPEALEEIHEDKIG
jgi:hypothetical protein